MRRLKATTKLYKTTPFWMVESEYQLIGNTLKKKSPEIPGFFTPYQSLSDATHQLTSIFKIPFHCSLELLKGVFSYLVELAADCVDLIQYAASSTFKHGIERPINLASSTVYYAYNAIFDTANQIAALITRTLATLAYGLVCGLFCGIEAVGGVGTVERAAELIASKISASPKM